MKIKKIVTTVGLSLAAITFVCAAVLYLANAKDAELSPEVSAKLSKTEPPSPDEERASRLLAELKIPSDQEPKFCSSSDWCPKSEVLKPEISDYLERHKSSLRAFGQLVNLPYYSNDPKNLGRGIFDFLKLAKLKRREWNLRLAKSNGTIATKSVADEMRNLNRFLAASLGRPQTIIEAQVILFVLKGNRNFLIEAARAEPNLRKAFEKHDFRQLMAGASQLEFPKVAANVHVGELRGIATMLQENLKYNVLMPSEIDAPNEQPVFWTRVLDKFVQAGFLPNDTLNRQSERLEKAIAKINSGGEDGTLESQSRRSLSLSPRNFIGRNIVSVLSSSTDKNFHRMKQVIATLSNPISFEATPN
jgi:hypothetical protein